MDKNQKKNNKIQRLNNYYINNPTMLSSPYTMHIDLFKQYKRRLTDTGEYIFSKINFHKKRVLDFGCGLGGLLGFSKIHGAKDCVGIDIDYHILIENEPLIDTFYYYTDNKIRNSTENIKKSSFKNNFSKILGKFDIVLCSEVLEHTDIHWKKILRLLISLLKENGILFISTPNYANLCGVFKYLIEKSKKYKRHTWAPFQNYKPQEDESFFTSFSLIKELRKYDLEKLVHRSIWWYDAWSPWIHSNNEQNLYTGKHNFRRNLFDSVFSKFPYGGLQFFCFYKKISSEGE